MERTVVLGFLGSNLDGGPAGASRWDRWRPTVSLCRHEDLVVSRLELLVERRFERLGAVVAGDVRTVSPETEVRIHPVDIRDPWDFEEVYGLLHDFCRGYPFDPERESYLVHVTTGTHVEQICLFLLTEARYVPGRLVQAAPPGRRDRGGPGRYSIIDLDLSRYDRLASRFAAEREEGASFLKAGIATRNDAFNRLIDRIERVAIATKAPILLTGPTGAGKSDLARRIFDLKRQRRQVTGAFVEVNCATLRGDAAMSALFGHVRGAFTGAVADRPGLLRAADGGVLFLDEIGELGLDEQAMLLRAVEHGRFLPVGTEKEVESGFQLLAGTNRDLRAAVRDGRFREDLLARIDLWTFCLPGLAARPEDVEPNLDFELAKWERREGAPAAFNREARERFLAFATSPGALWKANFREFNAAVTRMATLAGGGRIGVDLVEEETARLAAAWAGAAAGADADTETVLARHLSPAAIARLDRFDRVQLADVLAACEGARTLSDAGRALFAVSRLARSKANDADRLRKYLARHALTFEAIAAAAQTGASQ